MLAEEKRITLNSDDSSVFRFFVFRIPENEQSAYLVEARDFVLFVL